MGADAVRNTVGRYCQFLDDGRIDDVAALFAENGVLDIAAFGIKQQGRAAIAAQLRQTSRPETKGVHSTFNPVIEVSGDAATGSFDYVWIDFSGAPRIGLGGRYVFKLVRSAQSWLIEEMKVELRSDTSHISLSA